MTAVWAIYKKEIYSYFVSPLFYVAATVFLVLSGFYFHSDLAFYAQFGLGENVLGHFWQVLFVDLRLVVMITAPLLTMRLLAEEKKTGSLEILYTSPVTELEILLGKFASSLSVLLLLLICTLSFPVFIYTIQSHSTATVAAGYAGLVLAGGTFLACGLFLSSLTESQTVAALGSVGLLILLWMMDWNEGIVHPALRDFINGASMFEHFTLFANGVIDARDVSFYVFFTTFFALLTLRCMESRRWGGGDVRRGFPYLKTAVEIVSLCALWVVVQSAFANHVVRLDLTAERRFSLSPRSKRILKELDRNIDVVAFVEEDDKRRPEVIDLLHRISAETPRIRYQLVSANRNPALAREFGVRSAGAIVVRAENVAGRRVVTDFAEPVLFQAILQATEKSAQKVYFVTGHGEKDIHEAGQRGGYSSARSLLQQELYQVAPLSLYGEEGIPTDGSVVVVAGPTAEFQQGELAKLDHYLREDGVLLVLLDPGGSPSLAKFLEAYGIESPDRVVIDTDARLTAGEPWTFRVTGRPKASAILSELQLDPVFSVTRPVFFTGKDPHLKPYVLLTSSPESQALPWKAAGGSLDQAVFGISGAKDRGPFPLGLQVVVDPGPGQVAGAHRVGRLIVYGDSDFADNYFIDLLGNRDLLGNTVNWLAKEASFADLRSGGEALSARHFFITAGQLRSALWLGCIIQPGLFALAGVAVFTWLRSR